MEEKLLLIESETYRIHGLCLVFEKAIKLEIENVDFNMGYLILLEEIQKSLKKICSQF